MTYLVEPDLTEQELAFVDSEIRAGRFASRTEAILRLLQRGLESERMSASSINDPKHWQDRAAEMRALAADIKEENARAIMLRVAADYDKLATRAAMRADGIAPRSA